jgi:hypothetical protein
MIMSGLPPAFQIDCSTLLRFASVNARWVPSVRVPVPSAAEGSEPVAPFRRIALDPGQHRSGLARGGVVAGHLGLVGADQDRLHVALELEALEHLLVGELVVAAGVLDRPLRAGDARHLVGDLADIAEPHRRRGGGGGGVVAFELGVGGVGGGERLRLPFVIDGGRLLALDAGHERRVGRIDAIDHVGEILAVADRLVGGEGVILVGIAMGCVPSVRTPKSVRPRERGDPGPQTAAPGFPLTRE